MNPINSSPVICRSLKDTRRLARAFVKSLRSRRGALVLFDASMGAGKTTFICECVKRLGARVPASSPTFTIINNHGKNIFHIDLYRVEEASELQNTDFFDIISGTNFVFIEWAEKFKINYPSDAIRVKIEAGEGNQRVFNITC